MSSIDVSIILVSYNTSELTRNCIKSIYEQTTGVNFDIWVVDNNSADNSCEMIKSEFSNVHLIENKQNLGFGRANNAAISQAQGKYIFLLNTDTVLINNAVKILFDFMENNPQAGACGGNLYDKDNKNVHSYGHFLTFKTKMARTLKLGFFLKKEKMVNQDKGHNEENLLKEVDIIIGADLFLRREALNKAGLFDEDFFLYFEESELQYRVHKLNYKIYIVPQAKIYHFEGKSTKNRAVTRTHKMAGEVLFFKKCYGTKNLGFFKLLCTLPNLPRLFIHPKIISKSIYNVWKI